VVDQQQFNEMVTRDVLEGLLKENSRPILSTFVDLVSTDEELLEELDDLVRRKRG
jgi:predicted transcriptional regulator